MPVAIRKEGTKHRVVSLRRDALVLLKSLDLRDELSILICNDQRIAELNGMWRKKEGPTDVLSFPMGQGLLGDIVISVETAQQQANEAGHSLEVEMRVLLVHGLLHLCGYDHHTPDEDVLMAAAEARLLGILGTDANGLVRRATSAL